jgi:alkylation response protein AidB-like acyl-CoA dehydrogenase
LDFSWSDALEAYRQEVRNFAQSVATDELLDEISKGGEDANQALMRRLHGEIDRRGWLRMCWPREFGGEGKSSWYQYILFEELHAHGVPYTLGTAGMIGPAVMDRVGRLVRFLELNYPEIVGHIEAYRFGNKIRGSDRNGRRW